MNASAVLSRPSARTTFVQANASRKVRASVVVRAAATKQQVCRCELIQGTGIRRNTRG